ncbi:substrate-binding periplasmic protein [Bacteroidota bacterium]
MKSLRILLIAAILLSVLSCEKWFSKDSEKDLIILCEELKPYSFSENGEQKGISLDIVQNILDSRYLDNDIEISDSWDDAMKELKNSDNVVLFTTAITHERKDLFQWAGPIAILNAGFVSLENSAIDISSYDDAKELSTIGVITGYPTTQILNDEGFQNLKEFNSISDALQELYEEKIDAIFEVYNLLKVASLDLGYDVEVLKNNYTGHTSVCYIAFSKGISEDIVQDWQEEIDRMKDDGIVQQIYDEYISNVTAPGKLLLFTEENPPINYVDQDGKLTGSSIEIVEAIMDELNISEHIELTNWTNAYSQIELLPNVMTFSTLRTTSREDLFQWVGPVCKKSYCFFVKAGASIEIQSLDDAKQLGSVGTMTAWSSENQLRDAGFTNIVTWSTPSEVFQKLIDGEIDAAVLNDISIKDLAEGAGVNINAVRNEFTLSSGENFLAFSIDTDVKYVQDWESAYNSILNNGVFHQIWSKWYPNIDW